MPKTEVWQTITFTNIEISRHRGVIVYYDPQDSVLTALLGKIKPSVLGNICDNASQREEPNFELSDPPSYARFVDELAHNLKSSVELPDLAKQFPNFCVSIATAFILNQTLVAVVRQDKLPSPFKNTPYEMLLFRVV